MRVGGAEVRLSSNITSNAEQVKFLRQLLAQVETGGLIS